MNLEIKNVGTINAVDEMMNNQLWIGIDASPKTSTVFLSFSKEHGGDLEIALNLEVAQHLLQLLEQAVTTPCEPRV